MLVLPGLAETQAGTFAQFPGVVVDILIAQMVEQAGGVEGGLAATCLFVDQDKAQGRCPDVAGWHLVLLRRLRWQSSARAGALQYRC